MGFRKLGIRPYCGIGQHIIRTIGRYGMNVHTRGVSFMREKELYQMPDSGRFIGQVIGNPYFSGDDRDNYDR